MFLEIYRIMCSGRVESQNQGDHWRSEKWFHQDDGGLYIYCYLSEEYNEHYTSQRKQSFVFQGDKSITSTHCWLITKHLEIWAHLFKQVRENRNFYKLWGEIIPFSTVWFYFSFIYGIQMMPKTYLFTVEMCKIWMCIKKNQSSSGDNIGCKSQIQTRLCW